MEATERVERLRQAILTQAPINRDEPELLWARSWVASAAEPWHIVRRGRAIADTLRGLTPEIGPDDLLVGRFSSRALTEAEQAELAHWRDDASRAAPAVYGQRAHMAIDYDRLLRWGLTGLRQQIEIYRAALDLTRPDELERDAFYRACLLTLDALRDLSLRYADEADRLATLACDPVRRRELREIAAICRYAPEHPARTFREAMQVIHFVTFCLCAGQQMLLFQLGRPDRYLLPFYRRDRASGELSEAQAQELIDCLGLMLSAYTPRSLAVGYMIGGRDASGADICIELTRLMLVSIAHIRLPYPGIGLCWHRDMPTELLDRACQFLAEGYTHPAIFNDEVITQGLIAAGLPPAEACLYQHSTCVEISPIASSNVYVASPYLNLLQLLHDLLGVPSLDAATQGKLAGGGALVTEANLEKPVWATFDDLIAAYESHLAEAIRSAVVDENTCQATRYRHGGWPLLSCFVNDCLARGLDIDYGGARHNWIEPSFVGLANLIDALVAIRQLVYEDGQFALDELAEILRNDYLGHEDVRLRALNQLPKYGNDDDQVDGLAVRLTERIVRECRRYRTYLGGAFHPGFFCWVMHERLGAVTMASADGRRAGVALGDGSGPAQGRERQGPTAAILSATKWDHTPMLGGIAVNLKFSRAGRRDDFVAGLRALVETYLRRGGFEVQVNVLDRETLLAAQARPEMYRDLVVRIGGYSDYFVGLSPRMQEEIILRTEHESV